MDKRANQGREKYSVSENVLASAGFLEILLSLAPGTPEETGRETGDRTESGWGDKGDQEGSLLLSLPFGESTLVFV